MAKQKAPSRSFQRLLIFLKLLCLIYTSSSINNIYLDCVQLSIKNESSLETPHSVYKRLVPVESINLLTPSKEYMCARHCSCTLVQAIERSGGIRMNYTMAKCESVLFTDLLTIDRRTQIIHISLPKDDFTKVSEQATETTQQAGKERQERSLFRMPRLAQFQQLNEIVIVNLKFEVCDTEVFKRGQKLKRLKLNHNQLSRLSRSCFKHLDQLIELNLSHNKLEELESALFGSLAKLRSLSVAYNLLTDLAAHQFANLSQLVSLDLAGNAFVSINLHLFEPMQHSLRLLMLANNQIKTFTYSTFVQQTRANTPTAFTNKTTNLASARAIFKNLIKLNVDNNRLERIKALQLHRFFNVKYISVRFNLIGSIRDKAFNGLKLIELNLSNNQLQSISKCAFCNSTVKRLSLSFNNISLVAMLNSKKPTTLDLPTGSQSPLASALVANENETEPLPVATSGSPPQNILILSQSILSPLYAQLNYLDLSYNPTIGEQLDQLLEPLLNLEYLNVASVGAGPVLVSPYLFKNNQRIRYLNLSHNSLDQFQSEILEPLQQIEVLDLSYNKFDELDESFLVSIDEIPSLRVVKFAHNPWYCSQCKITPLYDWTLRSPIYNNTCVIPTLEDANEQASGSTSSINEASSSLIYGVGPQFLGDDLVEFELMTGDEEVEYLSDDQERLTSTDEDLSIKQTLKMLTSLASSSLQFEPVDFCVRCEEPSELQTFTIHELAISDFRFCPGAAPRLISSEPRLGLTLAIVIICALFCLIVIVIIIYRRKNNTYYPQEDLADSGTSSGKHKKHVTSNDGDHRFPGDITDYSSPPMSQSNESYSQEEFEEEEVDEEEEEGEEDDDEEIDEDEEDVYDEEEEEEYEEGIEEVKNKKTAHSQPAATYVMKEQVNRSLSGGGDRAVSISTDINKEMAQRDSSTEKSSNDAATKSTKLTPRPGPIPERSNSGPTPRNGSKTHHAPTKRQSSAHASQIAGFVASQIAWRNSTQSSGGSTGNNTPKLAPQQQVSSASINRKRDTPSMVSTTPGSGASNQVNVASSGSSRHVEMMDVGGGQHEEAVVDLGSQVSWQDVASISGQSPLGSLELPATPEDFEELPGSRNESGGALVCEPTAHPSLELTNHEHHKLSGSRGALRSSNSTHSALTLAGTHIDEE